MIPDIMPLTWGDRMKIFLAAMLAFSLVSLSAQADEGCGLKRHASLPMTMLPDGSLAIPATIDGRDVMFSLSFGGTSFLYKPFAEGQSLKKLSMPEGVALTMGGEQVTSRFSVPELKIGQITAHNVAFYALAQRMPPSPGIAGQIGPDILSTFDIEYDFAAMTMKLFSQDHCPGQVVYWADGYASVPLNMDNGSDPSVEMQLDGHPVSVGFFSHAGHAWMALATAKRIFGLTENAPDVTPVLGSDGKPVAYRYPFKALAADDLSIGHPQIDLNPRIGDCLPGVRYQGASAVPTFRNQFGSSRDNLDSVHECFGVSEVNLGLDELRKLHLFFAFKEKTLYLTGASATKAQ